MKSVFLLLSLTGSLLSANAQLPGWGISFTPAVISTNGLHYGLQMGVEHRINPRMSVLTELAILPGSSKDSVSFNTKYFRIKPEFRYLLSDNKSTFRPYAGFQVSYSFRQWENLKGGSYFRETLYEDTSTGYDKARIKSPIFTSSLQLGTLVQFGKHFALDLFMGMGVRVVDTKYSEIENQVKDVYFRSICKIMFSPDPAYWVNGRVTRFHSNLGLRFLYRF